MLLLLLLRLRLLLGSGAMFGLAVSREMGCRVTENMTVWTRVPPHGMMSFDMSLIVGSVRYLFVTDRTLEQGGMNGLKVRVETRWSIKQPGAVRARMSGGDAAVGAGLAKIPLGPCCLPLFSLLLYSTAPKTQES